MSWKSTADPDPLSGSDVYAFVGSAMTLGTNTQVHPQGASSVRPQDDHSVIDRERERVRRLPVAQSEGQRSQSHVSIHADEESPEAVGHLALLQSWFVLAQSDISPRNFGRLQNAAIQFEGMDGSDAGRTLNGAIRLFLTFWATVKDGNQEPELYVAASGCLQAVWSHQNGWFLVIEFGSDDGVFWAIYQDADIVEGQQRPATIAQLAQNLQALASKPLRWRC